jgi:hypothetical protein
LLQYVVVVVAKVSLAWEQTPCVASGDMRTAFFLARDDLFQILLDPGERVLEIQASMSPN